MKSIFEQKSEVPVDGWTWEESDFMRADQTWRHDNTGFITWWRPVEAHRAMWWQQLSEGAYLYPCVSTVFAQCWWLSQLFCLSTCVTWANYSKTSVTGVWWTARRERCQRLSKNLLMWQCRFSKHLQMWEMTNSVIQYPGEQCNGLVAVSFHKASKGCAVDMHLAEVSFYLIHDSAQTNSLICCFTVQGNTIFRICRLLKATRICIDEWAVTAEN